MKTYKEFMSEAMVTIHTTTINLKTGGNGNFGIRVVFEVKHWNNAVWVNIIAANAGEIPAYATKHFKITTKTKVADIYKWAKAVSKEAMPKNREFNNMFQRIIDFRDPMNEGRDIGHRYRRLLNFNATDGRSEVSYKLYTYKGVSHVQIGVGGRTTDHPITTKTKPADFYKWLKKDFGVEIKKTRFNQGEFQSYIPLPDED